MALTVSSTLRFDVQVRTKKQTWILASAMAISSSKTQEESKIKIQNYLDIIQEEGAGAYNGTQTQFASFYTLLLEMGVIKNTSGTNYELSKLASLMASGEISAKQYFSSVFLNLVQEISGTIIHPLKEVLEYLKKQNTNEFNKTIFSEIENFKLKGSKYENNNVNQLYNYLLNTVFFEKTKSDTLKLSDKYDIDFLIRNCKFPNSSINLSSQEEYSDYLTSPTFITEISFSQSINRREKFALSLNSYQKIVYGAPGTGKSYSLSKEINALFSDFSIESEILDKQNPDISFWLVGATWGSDNKYDEFINNNYWINGWDDGYDFERAKNMKIGDYIVIKTSYFTGEKNSTPTLEIKAIGKVTEISRPGKQVEVNWLKKNLGIVIKGENFRSTVHNISKRLSLIDKIFTNQNLLNSYSEDIKTKERVTFYDGYTYGQFVGAYKPVPVADENEKADITYNYIPGPLFRHLVKAFNNPEHNFVLIIEEINRARADRVFGNIFQLLDRKTSLGESEYPISLSEEQNQYFRENMDGEKYAETIEKKGGLYLPSNFYIWATMNSADQGVYPMDSAFKRRWNFEYIGLDKNAENFGDAESIYYIPLYKTGDISEKGNLSHEVVEWNKFRKIINNTLLHEVRVPEDRLFAPFFVKPENFEYKDPEHDSDLWIDEEIFKSKILMYLFDDILRHRGKEKIFNSDIRSFSKLIATYEAGKNIFNEKITGELLAEEESEEQV